MTEEIKKLIIYTRKMKKREPLYRDYPEEFREEIRGYLESNHISRLYAHQVEMFEKVRVFSSISLRITNHGPPPNPNPLRCPMV